MSDDKNSGVRFPAHGVGGVALHITQPAPAPVIDVAEVRRVLAESTFVNDPSGIEVVFSMMRALLAEIDALNARVGTLMLESLARDRRDEPHDSTEGDR